MCFKTRFNAVVNELRTLLGNVRKVEVYFDHLSQGKFSKNNKLAPKDKKKVNELQLLDKNWKIKSEGIENVQQTLRVVSGLNDLGITSQNPSKTMEEYLLDLGKQYVYVSTSNNTPIK